MCGLWYGDQFDTTSMAFRRRRYSRRRRYRRGYRRRTFRGRRRTYRRRRLNQNTSYRYSQWSLLGSYSADAPNAITKHGHAFQLVNVPGYARFTGVYDEYKINAVVFRFVPRLNVNTSAIATYGSIFYAVDYDDEDAPADLEAMLRRQGARQKWFLSGPFSVKIKPRFLVQTYETDLNTGYANRRGWLDTNDPQVPHYGFKWVWTANTATTIDVFVKYYVSFRGVQ